MNYEERDTYGMYKGNLVGVTPDFVQFEALVFCGFDFKTLSARQTFLTAHALTEIVSAKGSVIGWRW